jgi:DNA polymerase-3 subunit epsilon
MRLRPYRRLPAPRFDTPWREAEFCVLDLETTGLDPRRDDIVSYGATIVAQARIHCGRNVYGLVRPVRPVSIASLTVHHIRQSDVDGAPGIDEVLDDLIGLIGHRALVAHEAWFEQGFLDRALSRRGLRLGRAVIDTAALLRACGLSAAGTARESGVEAAARRLGLPVHTPHHALGDAVTAAELLLLLATRLEHGRAGQGRAAGSRPLRVRDLCALSGSQAQRW